MEEINLEIDERKILSWLRSSSEMSLIVNWIYEVGHSWKRAQTENTQNLDPGSRKNKKDNLKTCGLQVSLDNPIYALFFRFC